MTAAIKDYYVSPGIPGEGGGQASREIIKINMKGRIKKEYIQRPSVLVNEKPDFFSQNAASYKQKSVIAHRYA
jgi:hypothetical protein